MNEDQLKRTRRWILYTTSVFFLGLTGCLDRLPTWDEPESETSSTNTETDEEDTITHAEQYRSYLEEHSIDVNTLSPDTETRIVQVEYATKEENEEALADEIGTIAGGYMQRLEAGWNMERLESIIYSGGEKIATWHAETEWFQEFQTGERTADELSTQILSTVELVND